MVYTLIAPFDCSALVYRWHKDIDKEESSYGSHPERVNGHTTRRQVYEFQDKATRDSCALWLQQFSIVPELIDQVSGNLAS